MAWQGGEVVRWGAGTRVDSQEHCCSLCSKFEPQPGGKECNVRGWMLVPPPARIYLSEGRWAEGSVDVAKVP